MDVGEELLHGAVEHRATPRHGAERLLSRTTSQEHSDRDHLHPVRDGRQHEVIDPRRLRGRAVRSDKTQDAGNREPVDVGVDEPDAQAPRCQARRQQRGQCRLADPAFAARDGDHAGQGIGPERHRPGRAPGAQHLGEASALLCIHDPHCDLGGSHARYRQCGGTNIGFDSSCSGASGDGERNVDPCRAVIDASAANHAELADRAAQLRIHHGADGARDLVCGCHRTPPLITPSRPRGPETRSWRARPRCAAAPRVRRAFSAAISARRAACHG